MKILAAFAFLTFALSVTAQTMPEGADPAVWARALALHKSAVIVDGHNDITSPMIDDDYDLMTPTVGRYHQSGSPFHTDMNRLKASGITGEFFSIYVAASYARDGGSMRRAMEMIDVVNRAVEKYPNDLTACTTAAEVRQAKKDGKICALMGIEGGHAIENSLYALRNFYRLGIRYMTLTHNNTNDWADACCDEKRHNGLTDFGKEVIREMNRLGMLVDLSHVSDKTMHDVLDIAKAPVIFSHSATRMGIDHPRGVPDDVLKRLPENGGVVMVVFYPTFLDQEYWDATRARAERLKPQLDALREQFKDDRQGFLAAERKLMAENPIPITSYTKIVDHMDHIKKIAGIDHIGLGSDYDGVPLLPEPMEGAEDMALVTYEMLRRGYTEEEIRKVLGENVLRAMERAEKVAGNRKISGEGSIMKLKK
jgi:membrane dipeptidase